MLRASPKLCLNLSKLCLEYCGLLHLTFHVVCLHFTSYSYSYTLQQKIVLRAVMQCYRLVGKGEFSASIRTAGDRCVVSGGQVEVRSRRQQPRWRKFAGRWTCLPVKRTGHHGQPSAVTDVTNPRLGTWLAWGRQDRYLGHSRRSPRCLVIGVICTTTAITSRSGSRR